MTNKEFETRRNERTEELAQTLMNNNYKIVSIVRNAYERGFADGKKYANEKKQVKVLIDGEQVYPQIQTCKSCYHFKHGRCYAKVNDPIVDETDHCAIYQEVENEH